VATELRAEHHAAVTRPPLLAMTKPSLVGRSVGTGAVRIEHVKASRDVAPFDAAAAIAALPEFPIADIMLPGVNAVVCGPPKSGKSTIGSALLGAMQTQLSGGVFKPATPLEYPRLEAVAALPSPAPTGYLAEMTAAVLGAADADIIAALTGAIKSAFQGKVANLTTVLTVDRHAIIPRAALVGSPNIVRFILPFTEGADIANAWRSAFSMVYPDAAQFGAIMTALPRYTALVLVFTANGPPQLYTYKVPV
jgi:hypothetical protein